MFLKNGLQGQPLNKAFHIAEGPLRRECGAHGFMPRHSQVNRRVVGGTLGSTSGNHIVDFRFGFGRYWYTLLLLLRNLN
jgi:hypothetical protein